MIDSSTAVVYFAVCERCGAKDTCSTFTPELAYQAARTAGWTTQGRAREHLCPACSEVC